VYFYIKCVLWKTSCVTLTRHICRVEFKRGRRSEPHQQKASHQTISVFTARSTYASAVWGIVILSIRPSVRLSFYLSVTRMLCDETIEHTTDILIPHERAIILVFWYFSLMIYVYETRLWRIVDHCLVKPNFTWARASRGRELLSTYQLNLTLHMCSIRCKKSLKSTVSAWSTKTHSKSQDLWYYYKSKCSVKLKT